MECSIFPQNINEIDPDSVINIVKVTINSMHLSCLAITGDTNGIRLTVVGPLNLFSSKLWLSVLFTYSLFNFCRC